MYNAESIRLLLLEELTAAQARNPHYSMRALAKRLKVSQPAISQILAGKRTLTKKSAEKILIGLDKNPQEIQKLLNSDTSYKPLNLDVFQLISDWHYYGILSLCETDDFVGTTKWIAKRLGISELVAENSIQLLVRLDLLRLNPKTKKVEGTGEQFEAMSDIATMALKKACRQNIELAKNALEETQYEERDFTAITMCFAPERMHEAKKLIQKFRRDFCKIMENGKKTEVYKMNVQLFPLTKRGTK